MVKSKEGVIAPATCWDICQHTEKNRRSLRLSGAMQLLSLQRPIYITYTAYYSGVVDTGEVNYSGVVDTADYYYSGVVDPDEAM